MSNPDSSILGPEAAHAAVDKTLESHRRFLYLCGCLLVLSFAWSALTSLDIVSEAIGEVIPRTKVKKIQHLEGGIVREILVREGDHVKQDQPLVVLDGAAAEANADELAVRLNSLMIESLRLEAESQGLAEPAFTPELEKQHKDLVDQARNLFQARRKRVQTDISSQAERVRQREQDIRETGARLENLRRNLPLVQRQVLRSEELYRERLVKEDELIARRKEENNTRSAILETTAAYSRGTAALAAAKEELVRTQNAFNEEVETELKKVQRELMELTQRMKKLRDSANRTTLRAPEEGIVKSVNVVSEGEVIQPGMTVIEIVPAGDKLVIVAHLPIQDIGYVRPGQLAVVKLASRDAQRFGNIEGKVLHVSPDAVTQTMPGGVNTFYKVLVVTEQDHFSQKSNRYDLFPGMRVVVGIHIGRRSVLGYFLDPFIDAMSGSLQER
ncbi:MAG: HlyD family type I secretion periplasmic adaptor subunit [Humidesulfovibrio sp.]|nr:HlyD family type I secretion periplasmic adaptor subunit [Humidesulfovibrio sp.]